MKKVTKDVQLKELKWLVNLIKEDGINCTKTIIFCNTMNEIAVVVNHLILELRRSVFYPEFSTVQDNCKLRNLPFQFLEKHQGSSSCTI